MINKSSFESTGFVEDEQVQIFFFFETLSKLNLKAHLHTQTYNIYEMWVRGKRKKDAHIRMITLSNEPKTVCGSDYVGLKDNESFGTFALLS